MGSCAGSPDDIGASAELERRHDRLAACAASADELATAAPGADLQQFPTEDIFERFADQLGFRGEKARAERSCPTRI